MNVSAAAVKSFVAIPSRRCEDGTKSRGMPMAVGSGAGWQNMPVLVSTATSVAVGDAAGGWSLFASEHAARHSWGVAIAIAVEIRWAMTHPTIFSRAELVDEGMRNRYILQAWSEDEGRAGAESATLIVSCKVFV